MLLVVIDDERGVSRWLDAAAGHAQWLGVEGRSLSAELATGSSVGAAWGVPEGVAAVNPPRLERGFLHATTCYHDRRLSLGRGQPAELWQTPGEARSNDGRVLVSLESGELKALVAAATPSQLVYARVDGAFVLTDDIRLLIRELGTELDPAAVYALLQHGAIPAPLTIARGVDRILPGHVLHLTDPSSTPRSAALIRFGQRAGDRTPPFSLEILRDALDGILAEVPRGAVIYFSGGVDSGLFAARFAELGRLDVRLANVSFGKGDEEAALARRMAAHLGLPLEQFEFRASAVAGVLEGVGREYAFPFADTAVMPATALLNATGAEARQSGAVVDGTGGGLFSLWPQRREWRRVYRVPAPVRRAGSALYRTSRLWERDGSIERLGRVARRSAQMPLECAAVTAQNPLAGIAYRAQAGVRPDEIERMMLRVPEALGLQLDAEKRFVLLDLIHPAAGHMAAKSFDPLHMRGVATVYPFLEPSLMELTLGFRWDDDFKLGTAKGNLKALLAESVPPDMVYRPKASLIIDLRRTFAEPAIHDFIGDVALAPGSPLRSFVNTSTVESLLEGCRRGTQMSIGAYYFLWALGFTSGWLHALE